MQRALDAAIERAVRRVALDLVYILTSPPSAGGTPIDTGWARSNWLINIGRPAPSPVGSRSSVQPLAPAIGPLLGYRVRNGSVYVTNNVPYIVLLNDGSSRQAPSAFVQRGIDRAVAGASGGGVSVRRTQ